MGVGNFGGAVAIWLEKGGEGIGLGRIFVSLLLENVYFLVAFCVFVEDQVEIGVGGDGNREKVVVYSFSPGQEIFVYR